MKLKPRGCGCLILIVLLAFAFLGRNPGSDQGTLPTIAVLPSDEPAATISTPEEEIAPVFKTATALKVAALVTPSATITDTSTPTEPPPTLPPQPTSAPPETWYTVSTANLRSCASTDCDQIIQLSGGMMVTIIGYEQGESYKGSDIWRIVDYNGQRLYVHSSLVAVNAPQPTAAPVQVVYPTSAPVSVPVQQVWNCTGDIYNCNSFSSRADLMSYFNSCPGDPSDLDHDGNGIPCESN